MRASKMDQVGLISRILLHSFGTFIALVGFGWSQPHLVRFTSNRWIRKTFRESVKRTQYTLNVLNVLFIGCIFQWFLLHVVSCQHPVLVILKLWEKMNEGELHGCDGYWIFLGCRFVFEFGVDAMVTAAIKFLYHCLYHFWSALTLILH